eukprot:2030157-Rhodomonas_salina.1
MQETAFQYNLNQECGFLYLIAGCSSRQRCSDSDSTYNTPRHVPVAPSYSTGVGASPRSAPDTAQYNQRAGGKVPGGLSVPHAASEPGSSIAAVSTAHHLASA